MFLHTLLMALGGGVKVSHFCLGGLEFSVGNISELTHSRFLSVAWTMTDYDGTTQ